MLLTELKEFSFEREKEGAIEISDNDYKFNNYLDCNVLISTGKPLDGKYYLKDDEDICYFKNGKRGRDNNLPAEISKCNALTYTNIGKFHRTDGPAVIYPSRRYFWWINGFFIERETINKWLKENNISLDWNLWSDLDKFYFALHWSDYNE